MRSWQARRAPRRAALEIALNAPTELTALEIERRRLSLEERRYARESRFLYRYMRIIVALILGASALGVAAVWMIENARQRAADERAQERRSSLAQGDINQANDRLLRIECAKMIFGVKDTLTSADPRPHTVFAEALKAACPPDLADRAFRSLAAGTTKEVRTVYENAQISVGSLVAPLTVPAKSFAHGVNVEVGGGLAIYGHDVLHNAPPYNTQANLAEYQISLPWTGRYEVSVEYASEEARPASVFLNGTRLAEKAMGTPTGGWGEDAQRWFVIATVEASSGPSTLLVKSAGPFPHIRRFLFRPISTR